MKAVLCRPFTSSGRFHRGPSRVGRLGPTPGGTSLNASGRSAAPSVAVPRHSGWVPLTGLALLSGWLALFPPNAAAQPPAASLAGSSWQLVGLQSMDDAIGRQTPKDPTVYTLRFGGDGMALMRLDCNRGRASWRASAVLPSQAPTRQGVSGSLRFGPLALTRARCPAPSLSDTVARQLPFVRSFVLRNNRLYLNLMADGGILEWRPPQGGPQGGVPSSRDKKPAER